MTNRGIIRDLQLICRGNGNLFSTNLDCFLCLYLFLNLKFDLPTKLAGKRQFFRQKKISLFRYHKPAK